MSIVLRTLLIALIVVGHAASAGAAEWGDVKGRFVFDGDPPAAAAIDIAGKDAEAFGDLTLIDESLLVDENGGLANVLIYLRASDVDVHPDLAENVGKQAVLDNKDAAFVPRVLPVWRQKQKLLLTNSDPVAHNCNLRPLLDSPTNPLLLSGCQSEHEFNRDQNVPVPVVCNLHPWMQGYVLPRSNAYAAASAADGISQIEILPVGKWEFQVWHERAGFVAKDGWNQGRFMIEIKPGQTTDLGTIKLSAQLFKSRSKTESKEKT